ncbi:MAG: SusC/RagA family TonB-linked outer membrane protein [Bacteroidota bacterium]
MDWNNTILKRRLSIRLRPSLLTLLILLLISSSAFSQTTNQIKGTVTDEAGEPIPGATIIIVGTTTGTSTSIDGSFSLVANSDDVLRVSFVGYESKEIQVEDQSVIDVSLSPDVKSLEEVVVVGYGTQKKSSMTSAVSDIKGEDLERRPVSNAPQALQGLAPGVTVVDWGGAPGVSNATIRVRGVTTLGNNNPLIIVDGIEQNFQNINPNDIESITVLKDAASTAIYGSRAANGVVLVTTKKGSKGKVTVNLNSYLAVQTIADHPEHMETEAYMRMLNVGFENAGEPDPRFTEDEIAKTLAGNDRINYPLPNIWYDVLFSPALQQNHTLTVSGGTDQIQTLLSVNNFQQDGMIPNSESGQNGIRFNTNYQVTDRLSVSGDFNYRLKEFQMPLEEYLDYYSDIGGYNSALNAIFAGGNFVVPRYPDGTLGVSPAEANSPLVHAELDGLSKFRNGYSAINLQAELMILKGLKFKTQYGVTIQEQSTKHYKNKYEVHDYFDKDKVLTSQKPNEVTEIRQLEQQATLNNLLTYETSFSNHSINMLLGYSQIAFEGNSVSASRQDFYNNDIQSLSQGSVSSRDNDGREYEWGLRSYFGRLSYNFSEKYFVEANARFDGSSRFTGDNKYSFFPSISGAWRLSQESFWNSLVSVVDEFKLRGSWGQTGNQAVGLYSYLETLSARNYTFGGNAVQGIYQSTLANSDLTWETTTQTNVGFDAQFLSGMFGVTFDYYDKLTEGILLYLPIPATIGLEAPPQNAGSVQNKGWEVALTHRNIINEFEYNISFNISDVHNEIVSLAGTGPYLSGSDTRELTIRKEGYPIDAFMGYRVLGLFQTQNEVDNYPLADPNTQPGDLKYEDVNNDGQINTEDLVMVGSAIPHYTYGMTINMEYKNFDVNIFFQGVGKSQSTSFGAMREGGNWEGFTWEVQKDYWTPENPDAKFPRPEAYSQRNDLMSDYWMINTSYLKLKNLQIGYTLPGDFLEKIHIQKCRIYISGTNLLTFSEAKEWGLDPEFPASKLNYYPQTSLKTLGINLTF